MANTLNIYDPIFYAQEALIHLEKALGMGMRVHRGYDRERKAFGKGSVIEINNPSTFTVANAPATAQDLDPGNVTITLDQWKEVKFKLSDKELAFSTEQIIQDHIRPAAYALADNIDTALCALYTDIPWFYDISGTPVVADIIEPRRVMFDNAVPVQDIERMHYMIGGSFEAGLLGLSAFSQQQGAGDAGVATQLRGSLGTKYGMEIFANQNVQTHTKGTLDTSALLTNGTPAAGAVTMNVDAASVTGTLVDGDSFVIAGNTQRYAVNGGPHTASGNAIAGLTFTPGLAAAPGDGAAVTVSLDTHTANTAFHRNAFALAMAPLSELGGELGARIATITDPVSSLALRSRLYYVGDSSEVHVALDVLYGVKTLDPNLACRGRG